jgi:hypothetical protein
MIIRIGLVAIEMEFAFVRFSDPVTAPTIVARCPHGATSGAACRHGLYFPVVMPGITVVAVPGIFP